MAVWNKTALSLEWFQVLTVLHQKKVVINSLNFQPQRKGCIKVPCAAFEIISTMINILFLLLGILHLA